MPDAQVVAHIAYDGDALKDGSMDVRDLAPALLSLGDLLQAANRILNGDKTTLAVKVQADFKTGSFDVGIALFQGIAAQMASLIGSEHIKTAEDIARVVGLVTGAEISLFGFLKWLRGRSTESTTVLSNGKIEIRVNVEGDNNNVDVRVVPATVYDLASDPECRKAAEGVVRPLNVPGIDTFESRAGRHVVERVTKEDLSAFAVPTVPPQGLDEIPTVTQVVEIVKPSFAEDLTWTFSDGSARFDALMKDEIFIARVKAGEDFRIGDLLRVTIETKQYLGPQGLRARREVTRVVEELKVPRQAQLLPTPRFAQPPLLDGGTPKPGRKRGRPTFKRIRGKR